MEKRLNKVNNREDTERLQTEWNRHIQNPTGNE